MAAIETNGLTKQFGESIVAVDDLDITVEEGEVYGFLGPNGAGKSTTINLLLNYLHPTAGEARILGHDTARDSLALRERVGILPEGAKPYDRLSAREHLELTMEIKGVYDDPDEILARVGLSQGDATRYVEEYSKGMVQRLGLGMALVGDPDVLILDEPSSGLDPTGMKEMRELIREEASGGTAVFFSSHILAEVEAVSDRVGILNDGRLVAVDTVDGLREATGEQTELHVVTPDLETGMVETVSGIEGVADARVAANELVFSINGVSKFEVLTALDRKGVTVDEFTVSESSLEDLFEAYTVAAEGGSE